MLIPVDASGMCAWLIISLSEHCSCLSGRVDARLKKNQSDSLPWKCGTCACGCWGLLVTGMEGSPHTLEAGGPEWPTLQKAGWFAFWICQYLPSKKPFPMQSGSAICSQKNCLEGGRVVEGAAWGPCMSLMEQLAHHPTLLQSLLNQEV